MIWNKSGDILLTAAKSFVVIDVIFLVAVVCYVSLFIPKLTHHEKYARTCLTTSEGRTKCDRTEIQMLSYVKKVLENKYDNMKKKDREERAEYFKDKGTYHFSSFAMKPAAKMVGKRSPEFEFTGTDNKEMTPIDVWLEERGGFLRGDVRYYKGRLVVPVAGSYFVYSFVEFYEPYFYTNDTLNVETCPIKHYKYSRAANGIPNVEDKVSPSPIKHAIYKYSIMDNKNTVIVLSAQPHKIAKDNDEIMMYNSHISTVLHLNAGDELSVQVSNVTLLSYTRDNYFGLRLI